MPVRDLGDGRLGIQGWGWPVTRVPPPEPPVPPKFFDTGYGEGPNTRYPGGGVVRTNDGGGMVMVMLTMMTMIIMTTTKGDDDYEDDGADVDYYEAGFWVMAKSDKVPTGMLMMVS